MNRRLYFLLPDKEHALSVVNELSANGIENEQIHAMAKKNVRLNGLPGATWQQYQDSGRQVEHWLWNANLVVFGLALGSLLTLWATLGMSAWLLVPVAIMLATFLGGLRFTKIPNIHLDEFRDAMAHGEILVMVDVSEARVADIEDRIHHHHPEAAIGGVGWGSPALGL